MKARKSNRSLDETKFHPGFIAQILILLLIFSTKTTAAIYVLNPNTNSVGTSQTATSEPGETLDDIGRRFDIGSWEMKHANPKLSSNQILSIGTKVTIPSHFTLPKGNHEGIVINRVSYRLFYFPKDENVVYTFPVGIGRVGWDTPLGTTRVVAKTRNPKWWPSKALQKEGTRHGVFWPDEFPSNEANPLGKYALRLGWESILIHGTNAATSVGKKVSAGCIRMLPEDIEELFSLVTVGTEVRVIDES